MPGVMNNGYRWVKGVFKPSKKLLEKAFPTATDAARDTAKYIVRVGYRGYTSMEEGIPIEKIEKVSRKAAKGFRRGLGV